MEAITYNIPVALAPGFPGRTLIVRTDDPMQLVDNLVDRDLLAAVAHVKLLALDGEIDGLLTWGRTIPIELVVSDIDRDLPLLYRYAPVLATHPIRVSVPLAPGFARVVKLATALNFAVKLEGGQPEAALAAELQQMASFYLHQPMVTEPIEFFHSLFLAFYHREPVTLWTIQEEDPSFVRLITDGGKQTMPGRLTGVPVDVDFSTFLQAMQHGLPGGRGECAGCEFAVNCRGYFKWPRGEYQCDGVRTVLHTLCRAAAELRADIASLPSAMGERV